MADTPSCLACPEVLDPQHQKQIHLNTSMAVKFGVISDNAKQGSTCTSVQHGHLALRPLCEPSCCPSHWQERIPACFHLWVSEMPFPSLKRHLCPYGNHPCFFDLFLGDFTPFSLLFLPLAASVSEMTILERGGTYIYHEKWEGIHQTFVVSFYASRFACSGLLVGSKPSTSGGGFRIYIKSTQALRRESEHTDCDK